MRAVTTSILANHDSTWVVGDEDGQLEALGVLPIAIAVPEHTQQLGI